MASFNGALQCAETCLSGSPAPIALSSPLIKYHWLLPISLDHYNNLSIATMDDLNTNYAPTQNLTSFAASTTSPPEGTGTEASHPIPGPSLLVWEPDTPPSKACSQTLHHGHAHVTMTADGTWVTIHRNNNRFKGAEGSEYHPVGTQVSFEAGDCGLYEDDGTVLEGVIKTEQCTHAPSNSPSVDGPCVKQTTNYMPLYLTAPDPDNSPAQKIQRGIDMTMAINLLCRRMLSCSTHNDAK